MRARETGGVRWTLAAAVCAAIFLFGSIGRVAALDENKNSFPSMAPVEHYRMTSRSDEIALARSAAPASISSDAEILVLGDRGYEPAVKGKNGFVCLVERSWFASFDDSEFWNAKNRAPICLNAAAANSVLPADLQKTQWVLAGVSKAEMIARTKSSASANQAPAPGSMGYMMSKQGHLNDAVGHWHSHLMLFQPHTALSAWGAGLPGSPVIGQEGGPNETTVFFAVLGRWSDGTAAPTDLH